VAGPAIGGVLSQFGLTTPFWFASGLALAGTILGVFFLPETLKKSQRVLVNKEPLIDLGKLVRALGIPAIGTILLITLFSTIGHQVVIIGFQSYSVDILRLNATQIGLIFAMIGVISVVMQAVVLGKLLKWFDKSRLLLISITLSAIACFFFWTNPNTFWFVLSTVFYSAGVAPQMPVIAGLMSERTRAEDQGGMLGINAAYMSLGQIVGPILAGLVAYYSISLVFMLSGLIFVGSVFFMRFSGPVRKLADI
jgi:predicted MFS family arabinose efflux permease